MIHKSVFWMWLSELYDINNIYNPVKNNYYALPDGQTYFDYLGYAMDVDNPQPF